METFQIKNVKTYFKGRRISNIDEINISIKEKHKVIGNFYYSTIFPVGRGRLILHFMDKRKRKRMKIIFYDTIIRKSIDIQERFEFEVYPIKTKHFEYEYSNFVQL